MSLKDNVSGSGMLLCSSLSCFNPFIFLLCRQLNLQKVSKWVQKPKYVLLTPKLKHFMMARHLKPEERTKNFLRSTLLKRAKHTLKALKSCLTNNREQRNAWIHQKNTFILMYQVSPLAIVFSIKSAKFATQMLSKLLN